MCIAIAITLAFSAIVARYWERRMDIDALLAASAVPLALSLLIALLSSWQGLERLFVLALISELLFLLLAWTGALMLGRLISRTKAITPGFVVTMLVLFACCMALAQAFDPPAIEMLLALTALAFLLYLVGFFVQKARPAQPALHIHQAMTPIAGTKTTRAGDWSVVQNDIGPSDETRKTRQHWVPHDTASSNESEAQPQLDLFGEGLRRTCSAMAKRGRLSAREAELLPLLVMGLTAREIGERVFISPQTVKSHRYRIYDKLGTHGHDDLVALFEEMRLS
jgi:DNA-binding CsgD family transcriptional regulator